MCSLWVYGLPAFSQAAYLRQACDNHGRIRKEHESISADLVSKTIPR